MKLLAWAWRQLCRFGRYIGRHRIVIGFTIGMLAVFFAVSFAFAANRRADHAASKAQTLGEENKALGLRLEELVTDLATSDNKTRCRIVSLVGTLLENTSRSSRATLASPTATADQKHAAQRNLDSVAAALTVTRDQLGNPTGKGCTPAPS